MMMLRVSVRGANNDYRIQPVDGIINRFVPSGLHFAINLSIEGSFEHDPYHFVLIGGRNVERWN